ncbi:hypothetical protein BGZ76_004940 [Entomortierella beljakovae]|nr:hypothetical protein BGZ76_004940 [Entomortierella beljakovae]
MSKRKADSGDESTTSDGKRQKNPVCFSVETEDSDEFSDTENEPMVMIDCTFCENSYRTMKQLGVHVRDRHDETGTVKLKDILIAYTRKEDNKIHCPCKTVFLSRNGFHKHLAGKEECAEVVIMNNRISTSSVFSDYPEISLPENWRTYKEGIFHAEGVEDMPESIKLRTLLTTTRLNMSPISLMIGSVETSVTVDSSIYDSLPDKPFFILVHKSKPEKIENLASSCSVLESPLVPDIIKQSPISDILRTRSYKELSERYSRYLNLDWSCKEQAGLIAARILTGSLVVNVRNGQAILINEVEVYGRDGMFDCHKEPTGEQKGLPIKTSIPSTTGEEHYQGVRPVTIRCRDGVRLIIGTTTCGILVTSCTRIDKIFDGSISVGGDTLCFDILESDVKNIRIYTDKECIKDAKKMKKAKVHTITKNFGIDNLRQIRSKFNILDTYRPTRQSVIRYKGKAKLQLVDVTLREDLWKSSKTYSTPMQNILDLFEDDSEISVIGNKKLDAELTALADGLVSAVSAANSTVETELKNLFFSKD